VSLRRAFAALLAGCAAALAVQAAEPVATAAVASAPRVLRYSFPVAETGFDPARVDDIYSQIVTSHVFDGLYHYDHLTRPFKVTPNVAEAMPEVSDDHRTWTVRIKPGLYFSDDPAFKGRKRELVAQDYVYAFKRFFDPAVRSPIYQNIQEEGLLGVDALRQEALKNKAPFDYDREIEGLRAIDRYTIRFKLETPRPRFIYTLAQGGSFGAVAREVIEAYGEQAMEHPVGTGPFRLAQWRRSSLIVLERNPNFRTVRYEDEVSPPADDAEGQALLKRFRGRTLPMIDRVEVSIIEVSQPRWLAFLNDRFDLLAVPLEYASLAAPNGVIAPNLARRGIGLQRVAAADRTLFYFNMEDPLVGGFAPEKVALRRAISLGTDVWREINNVRRGQAIPAQSIVAPNTWGYDPAYKTENSDYDVARAKALLDLYGYADRDGDGWREMPDGSPLTLEYATQPDALSRQFDEIWKRNMDALGLRLKILKGQWPEQLKMARAGQIMIWQLGFTATNPDVQDGLVLLYGPAAGGQNFARFRNAQFDELFRRMQVLPDGPERLALLREAMKIAVAYAPQKVNVHRVVTDLTQPWLTGYRRPLFGNQFWQYVDVDPAHQPKAR
jgi:ABC-type transport system substrate-binding protein